MDVLKDKVIFMVEDDALNFAIIRTILRRAGATVPYDHWGDTTLTRMKEYSGRLSMILLDLMLPGGVSGYDIFEAIKQHPEIADIPIVAVSAADADIEIPRAKELGFSGFISKPIIHDQLPDQLNSILQGKEIWT
ncbi:MAG: response regulator [Chloroflexota bacterium]